MLVARQMSKVQQRYQTTNRRAHPNDGPMTFCSMGIRHHRHIPNSNETAKVPNSWHRLLHRVEAKALAIITEKNIRSFVQRNIICRYEIPSVLVSNNGKQFDNDSFRDFFSQLGIKNHYSSPSHSQANRQVEVTTWLEGAKGIWLEELSSVLWAYKTTARTLTGETLF